MNDAIDYFHVTVNHVHEYFQIEMCMLLLFPVSNLKLS